MSTVAAFEESAARLDRMGRQAAKVMASLRENADPGENDVDDDVWVMQIGIDEARRCLNRAERNLIAARECNDAAQAAINEAIEALGGPAAVHADELLPALKGLLAAVERSVCDGSGPAQDAARAAIAKAGGTV